MAVKVILLAGQSNACGMGEHFEYDLLYTPEYVDLYDYGWSGLVQSDTFGPEHGISHTLTNDGTTYVIIKVALGATYISDWAKGQNLYNLLLDSYADIMLDYDAWELSAFVWVQGEADAINSTLANAYEAALTQLISDFRTDLLAPALPFVISSCEWTAQPDNSTVQAAQAAVVAADSNAYLFDASGISKKADALHYDSAGQVDLGEGIGAIINGFI